jgi:predicted RNase H-like nuclease
VCSKQDISERGSVSWRWLETQGFVHRATVPKHLEQRTTIEVFPSPAQVTLFPALNRLQHIHCGALRYKAKQGRSWPEIHSQWEIYRARMRSLEYRHPSVNFAPDVKRRIGIDITLCSGAQYKEFDDLLDGIFCAYLAYQFWQMGEDACWVIGDLEHGCVTVPRCSLAGCTLTATFKA